MGGGWLNRSLNVWKVSKFCLLIASDLCVWFRGTSQSRLLSMPDEFCFCFHLHQRDTSLGRWCINIQRLNGCNSFKVIPRIHVLFSLFTVCSCIFSGSRWTWDLFSLSSRANVWFQKDLNHIWHQGNLIGNDKLLFCRWGNDVNSEGVQDLYGIMKCGIWVILRGFHNDQIVMVSVGWTPQ